jgi:hypothetical protein
MADLNDALEWLNAFDISHLRNSTRERIERLKSINSSQPGSERGN